MTCCRFACTLVLCLAACSAQASLVNNADFEADNGEAVLGPLSWFNGGPVSYVLDDDSDGIGTRSVQIDANGGDWRSEAFFVTPGEQLIWGLDYKFLEGASGEFSADLRFFSGFDPVGGGTAGVFQGEQRIVVGSTSAGVWETLGPNVFEVPAGALTADVRISTSFFDAGITGGGVRFDDVGVRVPEPHTAVLLLLGSAGAWAVGRRARQRS